MDIERRRQAVAPPPTHDPGEPRLLELLRAEIEERGLLTFARFMQRALYEPGLGYYAASAQRPTRTGDFLTAPELHPVFGHSLARQLHEVWQRLEEPETLVLREYGAGRGALALSLLEGLRRIDSPLLQRLRYQPLDLPAQLDALHDGLRAAGLEHVLSPAADPLVGCVLANEYLDALPVHRLVMREGRLRELYVGWESGRLMEVVGELSSPALSQWFEAADVELEEGQRAEVSLAMLDWLREVGTELERGYVLVLDYAAEPNELYGPRRREGTLRAFRGQHVWGSVLEGVGRQDITAHLDLAALRRGAQRAGMQVLGQQSQAHFLLGCGLEEAMAEERARLGESWEEWLSLRGSVARLLDPRALGGYAVVVLGRGVEGRPSLRGLDYRPPPRA
ncbi:MAG TPA: SAM-dependent methyltransferase [Candidatus Limnocylindria bacterium]|nr:SAM-dependent methyltransferase [Candidatus Limnocylindria bacterium]